MEFRLRPQDFIEFFAKQQSSGSLENEMNWKIQSKAIEILYDSLCVVVSEYGL